MPTRLVKGETLNRQEKWENDEVNLDGGIMLEEREEASSTPERSSAGARANVCVITKYETIRVHFGFVSEQRCRDFCLRTSLQAAMSRNVIRFL